MRTERRGAPEPDDIVPLRRISLQLAALTVGLLCTLLLSLGIVTYAITDHALQAAMRSSLEARAFGSPLQPLLHGTVRTDRPGPPPPRLPGVNPTTNNIHMAIVNTHLAILLTDAGSKTLLDPAAARQVLRTGRRRFSTATSGGQTYLVLTIPILAGTAVQGAAQFSLPEHQYQASLRALLQGLLVVSAIGLVASALISGVLVRRAVRPIRAAIRHQRDFVADAAHELRTPLAITSAAVELGMAAGTPDEMLDALAQVQHQNSRLARMVEDLSLLARADSGALHMQHELVDLGRLVEESMAGVQILAEDAGVQMPVQLPTGIYVRGDTGRLHQLLLILLDNALKFTPAGGTIAVSVERHGGRARLQVRDSGPGIDPADLPHLFERFYRADRARSTPGTGLGLAIGRWIAEAHGGTIAVHSTPGAGALFTITLPLAR